MQRLLWRGQGGDGTSPRAQARTTIRPQTWFPKKDVLTFSELNMKTPLATLQTVL